MKIIDEEFNKNMNEESYLLAKEVILLEKRVRTFCKQNACENCIFNNKHLDYEGCHASKLRAIAMSLSKNIDDNIVYTIVPEKHL